MQAYQKDFIEFLLENDALRFGEFTLKSGRQSPYFFNIGTFHSGSTLAKLGEFYAKALLDSGFEADVLYGPAYKGIPLVSTTAIALYQQHQTDMPYCFNRKEIKQHGDTGRLVGAPLTGNVVMFDDVITAGTTVRETVDMITPMQANLSGIIIAFDRQERGQGEQSATQEAKTQYGIPIHSIISLEHLIEYMKNTPSLETHLSKIMKYKEEYGC